MACLLDRQAFDALRAASTAGDKTVDVYLDRERLIVVKVKNGLCTPRNLDAEDVETDEERFAEIPVVTTITEYLWMQAFVDDCVNERVDDGVDDGVDGCDEQRLASWLDGRAGANARFLKKLEAHAPQFLVVWEEFRAARIDEMVVDWLSDLGVAVAD